MALSKIYYLTIKAKAVDLTDTFIINMNMSLKIFKNSDRNFDKKADILPLKPMQYIWLTKIHHIHHHAPKINQELWSEFWLEKQMA